MKRSESIVLIFMSALMLLSSCAPNDNSSALEFTLGTNSHIGVSDEKEIYFNDDMDQAELNVKLEVDSGKVSVELIDLSNEEAVFSGNYSEDSEFIIELTDIKAQSEYSLKINTEQSDNVNLILTSDVTLS